MIRLFEIVFKVVNLFLLILSYPVIALLILFKSKNPPNRSEFRLANKRNDKTEPSTPATGIPENSVVRNYLTFDVECWFHAHNLGGKIPPSAWHLQETQVVRSVERLLSMLQARNVKATFFVLGWVADHFPEVVRMIDSDGHEIATHGYRHELITRMTPQEFETDLLKSLEAIGRHTSQEIIGHRASNFTVVRNTLWALEILARNGIRYDSSIFPIYRRRYGIKSYPYRYPHALIMPDGLPLFEMPLSTMKVGSRLLPIAGGGYFRLYPFHLTEAFIDRVNRWGLPAMVYVHPWELETDQARYYLGPKKTFQHYVNLESTEWKLARLLDRYSFTSIKDGLAGIQRQLMKKAVPLTDLYMDPQIARSNSDYLENMPRKAF